MRKTRSLAVSMSVAALLIATRVDVVWSADQSPLEPVFKSHDLIVLGDVKHGVKARVSYFSSEPFFAAMARSGVRHVAIEMPRVLGRQALGVEVEAEIEAFAQDVVNSGRWHFVDPDNPQEENETTQRFVASAMGRQVLYARRYGLTPIFYDFNNPLGGFRTSFNDPVYRCLAALSTVTWVRYGLNEAITKDDRDAAIMRERFSHDDELAEYIEKEVRAAGGGKTVVIPGFAHAVLPQGLTERLEARLETKAAVVAMFSDAKEREAFPGFLREQAKLLKINLTRTETFAFSIADNALSEPVARDAAELDGTKDHVMPPVCFQFATKND